MRNIIGQLRLSRLFGVAGVAVAIAVFAGSGSSAAIAAGAHVRANAAASNTPGGSTPIAPGKGKAKGAPLVFGYVNDDSGAAGAFPEETAAVKATIQYVNTQLDGIAGRPIKLVACSDDATPAEASSCATKVLQSNPIAILGGSDFATPASVPLFVKAGKPYLGGNAFSGPENTSSLSFQWASSVAIAAPSVPYAIQTLHAKSLTLMYPTGNPSALATSVLAKEVALKMGLKASAIHTVSFSATAPDLTAPMQEAKSQDPGAIIVSTGGPQCLTVAQAHQELGVSAPLMLPAGCFSTQLNKEGGAAYDDNVYASGSDAQADSPDWANTPDMKLFTKVMKQYTPSTLTSPLVEFGLYGFQTVMNVRNVLNSLKPNEITSKTIVTAFRSTVNESDVLGVPYTCKTVPVKALGGLCTVAGYIYKIENGQDRLVAGPINAAKYITSATGF